MTYAFVPEHLLLLANYLNGHDFDSNHYDLQCIYRTIINRSYYAAYIYAREWVLDNGNYNDLADYVVDDTSLHIAIVRALRELHHPSLSRKFFDFKNLRVDADYNLVTIITEEDAQKALDYANLIFEELS